MVAKKKIELKSPTNFAKNIKRKWLVWGGASVTIMFIGVMFLNDGPKERKRRVAPVSEFSDTTPENPNQAIVLSRIQSQLESLNSKADKERLESIKREEALRKELEALKTSQEENLNKALKEQKTELEKKIAEEAALAQKNTPSNNQASSNKDSGGIFIPTNKDDKKGGKTPPPPPIYVADKDSDEKTTPVRGNLPQNITSGGSVERGEPLVITGTIGAENVIQGSVLTTKTKTKKKPNTYLPAGSFVRGTLITGADFGAGGQTQKNPQPVLIKLQSDATLPGMAQYKLKDCFAIANGYGDLSSERAYMQGSRLSCVQQGTGKVLEASILTYIADSDGKLGMRGVLRRRSGMLLGKALLAGFADGASKVLTTTAQNAEQVVTGAGVVSTIDTANAGKMAMWSGAGNAMEKLADQYIKEAESIFPVIEVDSGRNITMIFQNGQELKWREIKSEGEDA